jgi:RimJ/RimL family protein N-acetyltransferase
MIQISRAQLEMVAGWFEPETPGPLVAAHIINTGYGHAWVDEWPNVHTVVVETNFNYVMVGEPNALDIFALSRNVAGFVAAPEAFVPLLEATFPTLTKWPRIIGLLPSDPIEPPNVNADLRRFQAEDATVIDNLSAESVWISQTWRGGVGLAQNGYGWGAWDGGTLASVACTFFLGHEYEDIGVVTEAAYRGMGLSTACCYELCLDIIARGRKPSWSTSTDNESSWRVAEKLGFVKHRNDWLYVVGRELPKDT